MVASENVRSVHSQFESSISKEMKTPLEFLPDPDISGKTIIATLREMPGRKIFRAIAAQNIAAISPIVDIIMHKKNLNIETVCKYYTVEEPLKRKLQKISNF